LLPIPLTSPFRVGGRNRVAPLPRGRGGSSLSPRHRGATAPPHAAWTPPVGGVQGGGGVVGGSCQPGKRRGRAHGRKYWKIYAKEIVYTTGKATKNAALSPPHSISRNGHWPVRTGQNPCASLWFNVVYDPSSYMTGGPNWGNASHRSVGRVGAGWKRHRYFIVQPLTTCHTISCH